MFSQVRTWDQIIYHHLRAKNIVIPRKINAGKKDGQIIGAYVKEPITGRHDWVVSFDLNSLYPHLIMQYNISPDTKMRPDISKEPCMSVDGVLDPAEIMACERQRSERLKKAKLLCRSQRCLFPQRSTWLHAGTDGKVLRRTQALQEVDD